MSLKWNDAPNGHKDLPVDRQVIVELEEEVLGGVYHVAKHNPKMTIVASNFHYDMPKIIRWAEIE